MPIFPFPRTLKDAVKYLFCAYGHPNSDKFGYYNSQINVNSAANALFLKVIP